MIVALNGGVCWMQGGERWKGIAPPTQPVLSLGLGIWFSVQCWYTEVYNSVPAVLAIQTIIACKWQVAFWVNVMSDEKVLHAHGTSWVWDGEPHIKGFLIMLQWIHCPIVCQGIVWVMFLNGGALVNKGGTQRIVALSVWEVELYAGISQDILNAKHVIGAWENWIQQRVGISLCKGRMQYILITKKEYLYWHLHHLSLVHDVCTTPQEVASISVLRDFALLSYRSCQLFPPACLTYIVYICILLTTTTPCTWCTMAHE